MSLPWFIQGPLKSVLHLRNNSSAKGRWSLSNVRVHTRSEASQDFVSAKSHVIKAFRVISHAPALKICRLNVPFGPVSNLTIDSCCPEWNISCPGKISTPKSVSDIEFHSFQSYWKSCNPPGKFTIAHKPCLNHCWLAIKKLRKLNE